MQLRNLPSRDLSRGFTLVEIMIVVSIVGMLAAIGIPNYLKASTVSQQNVCISNLRQINDAVSQWAIEHKKNGTAPITEADITPYLRNVLSCPAGGTTFADSYQVVDIQTPAACQKCPTNHMMQ